MLDNFPGPVSLKIFRCLQRKIKLQVFKNERIYNQFDYTFFYKSTTLGYVFVA